MDKETELVNGVTNLNLFSKRFRSAPEIPTFSKSLPQLRFLLEKANLKFHYPTQVVERCCYQLAQKGINLSKIEESLKDINVHGNILDGTRVADNCYFYVKDLSLNNIDEFIQKAHEYSVFNNIEIVMEDYEEPNNRLLYEQSKQNFKVSSTFRNDNKFKQYNQIISTLVSTFINQQQITAIQLLRLFCHASKSEFWELILRIFDGVEFQSNRWTVKEQLIQHSIRILEQEYNQRLPKDIVSLQMFVKGQLINKLVYGKNQVHFDNKGRPIWAIIYLLLRAGRIQDIKKFQASLHDRSFFRDLSSYLSDDNKTYHINEDGKDVFLQAIYSIFNRKPQCVYQILLDQKDYLWFALKTISINDSRDSQFSLSELQQNFQKRYDVNPSKQNFVNLILTLDFGKLIQSNPFIDSDDAGHFLLFLYMLGIDEEGFLNQNTREIFLQKMTGYAQELIKNDIYTALDYIILCFNQKSNSKAAILQMISDLLIYTNSVEKFFGDPPVNNTPAQQRVHKALNLSEGDYDQFVTNTMNKYVGRCKNYVYPAKVYQFVMENTSKSIDYLLDVLVKDILGDRTFQDDEVKQSLALIDKLQSQKEVNSSYTRLLQFVRLVKYMKDVTTYDRQIDQRVLQGKYFPQKAGLSSASKQILLDLNINKWLGLYPLFLLYCLKVLQKLYCFKTNRIEDYSRFVNNVRGHYQQLKDNGVFREGDGFFRQKTRELQSQLSLLRS